MKKIARINGSDNINEDIVTILADKDFNIYTQTGTEEAEPVNEQGADVEDLFRKIYIMWGQWETLEWLAEYDENEGVIKTLKTK